MPLVKIYASTPSSVKPYSLSNEELLDIGRLVRACAEIDDIINLHLYNLADITEGTGIILLGRMPTSARLNLVEAFAKSKGPEQVESYRQAFGNEHYKAIIRCRNTVAHGTLMGVTDNDLVAFQVQDTQGVGDNKVITTVNAYSHDAFGQFAGQAEDIIPQMETKFGLRALRENRRAPTLSPHSKSQPKEPRKARRRPPLLTWLL